MPDDQKTENDVYGTAAVIPTGDEPEEIDPAKTSESQRAWKEFINATRDAAPPPTAEENVDKTV